MKGSSGRWPELARFRRLGLRADAWALSSESTIAKELYSTVASGGRKTFADLQQAVTNDDLSEWDPYWVTRLARVIALQPSVHEYHEFAFDVLRKLVPTLTKDRSTLPLRKALCELLFSRSQFNGALGLLEADEDLRGMYHGYLEADILNPYVNEYAVDFDSWLGRFNRPFSASNIQPLEVDNSSKTPFDGLSARVSGRPEHGPLVTVILTTYNPDIVELTTSLRSILNQSWRNIEVLLIDDCSEIASYRAVQAVSTMDERVRLIRAEANGGTYRARNLGILNASGKYITGQDTDDWSHPERISRQAKYMEANPAAVGVTIAANRTDNNLVRTSLGHNPERRCEVSLMVRRETALAVGGYLPVRKAADSEFRERIEVVFNSPVERIDEPLYMIRMSPGSLSRADFRPGWSHHARRGFWGAYKYWHGQASVDALRLDQSNPPLEVTVAAPSRIAGREWPLPERYDLCIVSDWRGSDSEHRAALDELYALIGSNLSISILHLDTPWVGVRESRALAGEVQKLLNEGVIDRIYLDDRVEIDLLLVRDPSTVDYACRRKSNLTARSVAMVAYDTSKDADLSRRSYDEENANLMAEAIFGTPPIWLLPEQVESRLELNGDEFNIDARRYPVFFDFQRWPEGRLKRPRSNRTVIGRHAANATDAWPSKRLLPKVYPIDGSVDVRVFGDARGALREMGERYLPADWLQYKVGEILPQRFWRAVDVMVHFEHEAVHVGLERPVLEAMATGLPIVTDRARKRVYGDSVICSEPNMAMDSVANLMADSDKLDGIRKAGKEFVAQHSDRHAFRSFIASLINELAKGMA